MDIFYIIVIPIILFIVNIILDLRINKRYKNLTETTKKTIELMTKRNLLIKENTNKMVWYSVNREL